MFPIRKDHSLSGNSANYWLEAPWVDYMTFPRLATIAELGWSPAATHDWGAFKKRLGSQGPRWTALGINYYRSPQVPWA